MELNIISIIVYIYLGLCTEATCKKPPKIVNGVPASIEEFPFMVKLMFNQNYLCGGAIISEKYVLTAAHCTRRVTSPKQISLEVGKTKWSEKGVKHTVRKIIDHPGFNIAKENDISILEVDQAFQFNNKVQTIAMYPHLDVPDGTNVTVMGWGKTDPNGKDQSQELLRVDLEVWPLDECRDFWINKFKVTDNMICTGRRNMIGGSCQGDSGGPLIFKDKLIGIVSFGIDECGQMNVPEGVYTRVAAYKDWINNNTVRRRRRKGSRCRARFSYSRRSLIY